MSPTVVTRRRFLIGGAAVASVALGITGYEYRRQLLDHGYTLVAEIEGDDLPPRTRGEVIDGTFDSAFVDVPVGYSLAFPPDAVPGAPLPVSFCLPGRGGVASWITDDPLFLADFLGQSVDGGGTRFALAAVDGGESYWHERASGEDRMAMLMSEFLPLCANRYKLGGEDSRSAIIGWSMGGYGALLAAESYPDRFAACAVVSPGLWTTYAEMAAGPGDAFDDRADFDAHDVFDGVDRITDLPLLVQCGTADPFYAACREFVGRLSDAARIEFSWGNHTPSYWRAMAPAQMRFLGSALAG